MKPMKITGAVKADIARWGVQYRTQNDLAPWKPIHVSVWRGGIMLLCPCGEVSRRGCRKCVARP